MYITTFLVSRIPAAENNRQWMQILACGLATATCFTCGLLNGWTSPAIPKLLANDSDIPMTFEETSYLAIIHLLSLFVFAAPSSFLAERFGRKKLIIGISLPQIASWLLVAFARSSILLFISRVLSGLGDALIAAVVPAYIGEVSEKHIRGPIGCIYSMTYFLGQILINAIGYYFDIPTAAFISLVVPAMLAIAFLFMPESPYWLIGRNRSEDAKEQLQILRWRRNVDGEFSEIQKAVQRQLSEKSSFKEIFVTVSNRKALTATVLARFTQQFAGMFAITSYMQYIFQEAGGNLPSHTSSIICSALMALGNLAAIFLVDRFGRKPLMTISGVGCLLTLFALAVFLYLKDVLDTSTVSWLPLVFMIIYISSFSIGFSVVPSMLLGELFSAGIKGKATLIANASHAWFSIATTKLFQLLTDSFGLYSAFLFFGCCTSVMTVVLHFTFVETKNKTLEEIQQDLKHHK